MPSEPRWLEGKKMCMCATHFFNIKDEVANSCNAIPSVVENNDGQARLSDKTYVHKLKDIIISI